MSYFFQKTLFYWQEAFGVAHPKNSYKIALFSLNRFIQPTSILLTSAYFFSFIFFPGENLASSVSFFFLAEWIKISAILYSIGFMRPSVGLKNKNYSTSFMPQHNKTSIVILSFFSILTELLLSPLNNLFSYLFFSINSLIIPLLFLFYKDNNRETGATLVQKTALFFFFHLPLLGILFSLSLLPSLFLAFINLKIIRAVILLFYATLLPFIQAILVTVYTQRIHEQTEYYL